MLAYDALRHVITIYGFLRLWLSCHYQMVTSLRAGLAHLKRHFTSCCSSTMMVEDALLTHFTLSPPASPEKCTASRP